MSRLPQPELDEIQRSILEFLCRHAPVDTDPPGFEQRIVVCGELRLALHEYDAACGGLFSQGLIITDPPYAADCDSIAPTTAGRRAVARPLAANGLAQRLLAVLDEIRAESGAPAWVPMAQVLPLLGLAADAAGVQAYQKACQALYIWGRIERRRESANGYAFVSLAEAGRYQE